MCGKLSPPDTFPSLFGRLLVHNLRNAGVGIGTLYTARATAFRRGPSGCVYKAMIQVAGTAEELVNEHIDFEPGRVDLLARKSKGRSCKAPHCPGRH